jgi:hypothetical protein
VGKAEGKGCDKESRASGEENGWPEANECSHEEEIIGHDEGAVGG